MVPAEDQVGELCDGKPSRTEDKAAIKAMLVNRVGDFGLAPGISGYFTLFQTVDFSTIFARASAPINSWISHNMRLNAITLICILLLIGAVGKSAQIGSHTWSPDAMEGPTPVSALIHAATMALKRRTGTGGINVFQFLALHQPSNGPWTKRPLPERTMSRAPPPTRYISRLWAAITIQEDTRNWKDKQTHPVVYRATSPTTQERDSLKSQGRGWPRGPTWRLGISAGNTKVA
ncbi:hypothetical protein AgCh_028595 [Apium graveolens]